jgi:hypothetical protein
MLTAATSAGGAESRFAAAVAGDNILFHAKDVFWFSMGKFDEAIIIRAQKVSEEILQDRRRPTAKDLSGAWTSGPNLVGVIVQLEQKGSVVRGKGCHRGCTPGYFAPFEIAGTYRDGVLRVTYTEAAEKPENVIYRVKADKGFLRLGEQAEVPMDLKPMRERRAQK